MLIFINLCVSFLNYIFLVGLVNFEVGKVNSVRLYLNSMIWNKNIIK